MGGLAEVLGTCLGSAWFGGHVWDVWGNTLGCLSTGLGIFVEASKNDQKPISSKCTRLSKRTSTVKLDVNKKLSF